jgi:hypothetical protein
MSGAFCYRGKTLRLYPAELQLAFDRQTSCGERRTIPLHQPAWRLTLVVDHPCGRGSDGILAVRPRPMSPASAVILR